MEKPQTNQVITMADVKAQWDRLFKSGNKDATAAERMRALGYAYNNSPYIQNQRVKRVSTQPFSSDRSSIEKALADVENSELILRQTAASLYTNYALLKLNAMYADILTYRNYYYPKYVTKSDIDSKEYKEERELISRWIDRLQPKRTFQEIVEKCQWEGKAAYYMRDSIAEDNKNFDYVYLQQLPSDYIKIVGWNNASHFTIMFNFTYFWRAGTSPEQFPPIFKRYYEELNRMIPEGQRTRPNPNAMPENLSSDVEMYYLDNKWYYWHTLPMDECFTFSQSESNPYQIPNTAGLFLQAKDLQDYTYLQQELLQLPLNGVVMATMPYVKDKNGTTATDGYAIGTDAFDFFTNMFNEAAPRGVQLFLSPATNHQFFKFDADVVNNSAIVTNALQQFNSIAGVGGLNSTTDKPNMAQVKTQQVLESAYAERFYKQFENCVNTWWKNKLNLKYEWHFKIKGNEFKDSQTLETVKTLVSLGQNYLMPELLSYFDLRLDDAQSLQQSVIGSELYNNFQVVQSAYNQSSQVRVNTDTIDEMKQISETNVGRPNANENDIESDGTATSISEGANTSDGRMMSRRVNYCVECGTSLDSNEHYPFCSQECAEENINRVGE